MKKPKLQTPLQQRQSLSRDELARVAGGYGWGQDYPSNGFHTDPDNPQWQQDYPTGDNR